MQYPINEIFYSLQGEANFAGLPSVFIRMQGCAVGCAFCDTKHTWELNPATQQTAQLVAGKISEHSDNWAYFTAEDILFEILLKYGLDLTVPIEEKNIAGKTVYSIGLGTLFICLADGITPQISEGIGAWKQELNPSICRAIFKDSGFASDKDKVNAMQILKRFGIEEVNSI